MKLLADAPLGTIGGDNLGPFGNIGNTHDNGFASLTGITGLISSIIGFMTVTAAIWFLFMLLFAGYEWISAGGDSKKIASARERITHGFVGLVIVVGAWSLLAVVGQFFGFDTLLGNPTDTLNSLKIGK